jgi:hypothetical protein
VNNHGPNGYIPVLETGPSLGQSSGHRIDRGLRDFSPERTHGGQCTEDVREQLTLTVPERGLRLVADRQ